MGTFLLGIALGAVSGLGTYALTGDGQLGAIVAAVIAVLAWLGVAAVLFIDD
jgi:hypothetical protein